MSSSIVNDLNNYATEVHLEELRRTQGENQERQERERSQSQAEPSDTPGEPTTVRVEEELVLPTPPSVHAVVVGALCHSVYATSVWATQNISHLYRAYEKYCKIAIYLDWIEISILYL